MADTSTGQQRAAFSAAVEGGAPSAGLASLAAAVASSTVPMPATTSALLNLPDGATYGQGAAMVAFRLTNGGAVF